MLADLQFRVTDEVVAATLTGDVDASNASRLFDAIAEVTVNHSLGVVLDLEAVDYLDSAGIQLIYRLRESLRARGQRLMLVIPSESAVQHALRLAGVTHHLPISVSVDEALSRIGLGGDGSDRDPPEGEPAL